MRTRWVLYKLWNSSPRTLWNDIRNSIYSCILPGNLYSTTIKSGPLKGRRISLNRCLAEFADGTLDKFFYDTLEKHNLLGQVAWDIGAHVGYHSMGLATLVGPEGEVHAFEPHPENLSRFRQNLEMNSDLQSRIHLHDLAVGEFPGREAFAIGSGVDGGRSSTAHLKRAVPLSHDNAFAHFESIEVTVETVDSIIDTGLSLPPVVIKMDVEGAERLILRGASRFLAAHRPLLFIEVHDVFNLLEIAVQLTVLNYTVQIVDTDDDQKQRCHVIATPGEPRTDA